MANFTVSCTIVDNDGLTLNAYIANRSKVKAVFSVESGTAVNYSVHGTHSYRDYLSTEPEIDFVFTKTGNVTVRFVVGFEDENGEYYTEEVQTTFVVRPYEVPKVVPAVDGASDIVCRRCADDGTASMTGTNARVTAARRYSPVLDADNQTTRNFCSIRYRWKVSTDSEYGEWTELLSGDDLSTDAVDTVLNLGLGITTAYDIQVGVADTAGGSHTVTKQIPTARTPLHLGRGGKNIGLGGFCDYSHEEAIDAVWDMWLRRGLEVLGDARFAGAVNVDGQLMLGGGIGIKTVFRRDSVDHAGWESGQKLSEAFPDADQELIRKGSVFLAVVFHRVSYINGTATSSHIQREAVICARIMDNIDGFDLNMIRGSGASFRNITGDYAPRCQHAYHLDIRDADGDHTLNGYYMQHNDSTMDTNPGSHGALVEMSGDVCVEALYVLL